MKVDAFLCSLVGMAALCLVLSCASVPSVLGLGPSCLVVPVSSADLPEATRLRARMRIGVGEREIGLELIARKERGELVVVGLAPHGIRLFAATQRGREIEVAPGASREIEHLALWVMDALHRGVFIEPPMHERKESEQDWHREGEQIRETWRNGHRRREFRRVGDEVAVPPVAIDYRDSLRHGNVSGFEIRNAWCGYEAVLVPLDGD